MSAHWSKWGKGTRQTRWKDSEAEKVAFWYGAFIYTKAEASDKAPMLGEGSESVLRFYGCVKERTGSCVLWWFWHGEVLRVDVGGERLVAVEGCAQKPRSIGHGVEGRKPATVEVGKEVVVVAQVQSLGSEVGTWMEDLKRVKLRCTLGCCAEPALLKVVKDDGLLREEEDFDDWIQSVCVLQHIVYLHTAWITGSIIHTLKYSQILPCLKYISWLFSFFLWHRYKHSNCCFLFFSCASFLNLHPLPLMFSALHQR